MKIFDMLNEVRTIIKLLPRQLITTTVFYWTFPISIFLPLLVLSVDLGNPSEVGKWLFIGLVSHLAMYPFVIYGLKGKSIAEQVALTLAMGVVRGAVISLLPHILGVQDSLSLLARVVNSAVAVFYWFQAGSIIVEYGHAFRDRVKVIINEILEKQIVGMPRAAKASSHELTSIIGHLQEKIVATVGAAPSTEELQAASKEIDNLIAHHIKPLSKSRWRDGELVWVRAGFLAVLRRTLESKPIPVIAVLILTFPFAVVVQINNVGLIATGIIQLIWTSLTFSLNILIYRNRNQVSFLKSNLLFLISLILISYPITFYVQYTLNLANPSSFEVMLEGYLLSIFSEILLFLIGTLLVSIYDDQEFAFTFLRDLIKQGELEGLLEKTRTGNADAQFAQYLHAEVQSQLLACKLLLLKAAESDFDLFPPEITQQIIERMEKISQPYDVPAARIPAARIQELSESWAGLANINHQFPSELAELQSYSDIASQLIEEAVVNSIRHGGAKEIFISAKFIGSILEVEITDNGILLEGSGARGLGSILFDTFTTSWSRSRVGNSTIMKFDLDTSHKETLR